jgi:hypothetical protein
LEKNAELAWDLCGLAMVVLKTSGSPGGETSRSRWYHLYKHL